MPSLEELPVWKCQTVKRLKGKPADVNIDGGNVISSTLFVCAVHFLSRELFVIFSPALVSLYKFIFLVLLPCAFSDHCFLVGDTNQTANMKEKLERVTWIVTQTALGFYRFVKNKF